MARQGTVRKPHKPLGFPFVCTVLCRVILGATGNSGTTNYRLLTAETSQWGIGGGTGWVRQSSNPASRSQP